MDIAATLKKAGAASLWCYQGIKWGLMDERKKVETSFALKPLQKDFKHPDTISTPTVEHSTRYALEALQGFGIPLTHTGLSKPAALLVTDVLRTLVVTKKRTAEFEISKLHGFCASKSDTYNHPRRASQLSMAAMGREVNDLRKLKGLEGQSVIDECLAHNRNRISKGLALETDNWHKRYYWNNGGGSHHMSRLCYELQRQNKKMFLPVTIKEHCLDTICLGSLIGKVSIFVISRKNKSLTDVLMQLPNSIRTNRVIDELGLYVDHNTYNLDKPFYKNYKLVFVDHSKEYSDISYQLLLKMVYGGEGMLFIDFMNAFFSLDHQVSEPDIIYK